MARKAQALKDMWGNFDNTMVSDPTFGPSTRPVPAPSYRGGGDGQPFETLYGAFGGGGAEIPAGGTLEGLSGALSGLYGQAAGTADPLQALTGGAEVAAPEPTRSIYDAVLGKLFGTSTGTTGEATGLSPTGGYGDMYGAVLGELFNLDPPVSAAGEEAVAAEGVGESEGVGDRDTWQIGHRRNLMTVTYHPDLDSQIPSSAVRFQDLPEPESGYTWFVYGDKWMYGKTEDVMPAWESDKTASDVSEGLFASMGSGG